MAIYCLKSLTVTRLSRQDYDAAKGRQIAQEEMISSQSLAPVHFNPANILDRMHFEWTPADEDSDNVDANNAN